MPPPRSRSPPVAEGDSDAGLAYAGPPIPCAIAGPALMGVAAEAGSHRPVRRGQPFRTLSWGGRIAGGGPSEASEIPVLLHVQGRSCCSPEQEERSMRMP